MVNGRAPAFFLPLLVASTVVTQLSAQQVATVEVFPDDITLEVGERIEIFAEASDALGDFIEIPVAQWFSSDETIATIELDMTVPGVATAIAVGSGTATLSVRIQTITTIIPVTVVGPVGPAAPPVAGLPPGEPPAEPPQVSGGKFPLPIVLVGALGAVAAAALFGGGGGGGGGDGGVGGGGDPTTSTIEIFVPFP